MKIVLQGRPQRRDLAKRGEFDPSAGLRLPNPFENVLGIIKQRALEKRECARLLERDHDRHVLFEKREARLAPLEFFAQAAAERDPPQGISLVSPLLRKGNFHVLNLIRRYRGSEFAHTG